MPPKRKETTSADSPTNKDKLLFCYFVLDPDSKAMHPPAICTECGSTIRRPRGKDHALLRHLKTHHKFLWEEYLDEDFDFTKDTGTPQVTQEQDPTEADTDTDLSFLKEQEPKDHILKRWRGCKKNLNDIFDQEDEEEDNFTFVKETRKRQRRY